MPTHAMKAGAATARRPELADNEKEGEF